MTVAVEDSNASRRLVAVIGALLLVEMVVCVYLLLAIWPDVAQIPNATIVTSSDNITATTTTSSPTTETSTGSSTTSSSTTATTATTVPPTTVPTTVPAATPSTLPGSTPAPIHIFGWTWEKPTADSLYLVLVIVVASIGALVHALTSLARYRGTHSFDRAWSWYYIVRVPVGIGLALIFYTAIRGGLLSVTTNTSSLSPYGIAAIAALTGMFAKKVTEKLRALFDALFGSADGA